MYSPDIYWNIFLDIGGSIMIISLLLGYPLGYFCLLKPFDRKFKRIGVQTIENGIFLHSAGIRTFMYASNIVFEVRRGKKIKNRLIAPLIEGGFRYQARMYEGQVNFRKAATRLQIATAYLIMYGLVFMLFYGVLYVFHDFVLFPEFAKAKRG